MNELSTQSYQLPDTIEDLSKFVLVGREKLVAVRAEIRAIEKVELAKEVHEQKLREAQDIAEAVLDAEVKIGELTKKIEKATNGGANQFRAKSTALSNERKPKSEALAEIGIKQHTANRYEKLATHPEVVERAKADARAEGRIVTRQDVLSRIVEQPKSWRAQVRETERRIEKEHRDFQEAKKEGVVNFEDAQKDKSNLKFLVRKTGLEIRQTCTKVDKLAFKLKSDFTEVKKVLGNDEIKELQDMLVDSAKVLNKVSELLGGE